MIPTILDTLLRWFPRLVRLRYRLQLIRNSADELNRRVTVEQQLLDAAAGKRPLPDAAECRRLALQLGVPADFNRRERGQVPPKAPPPPKKPVPARDEHEAFPGEASTPWGAAAEILVAAGHGNGRDRITALRDFAESCLNPERNGYAVPAHVRDDARRALGIPPSETVGDRHA